nr:reverse transcriptase domain-containing protein [Tanacetum cinerariifolium]
MADQRTMAELLRAPTEGYAEAIVVPSILAEQFELKHSLINMMTSDQFFGLEKDNPHDHIYLFNKITSTVKYKDVPNLAIKLMLFPFSLAGAARRCLEKEPSRSILPWEDLVSNLISELFPSSRTTNLRNEISNFQQRFDESFHKAWDRYKDLLSTCPHHGFTELHQLDTFYNALNPTDQDSLNSVAGGNLLERRTQDMLTIIENKSKVCNSQNKSVVSQVKSSDANSNSSSFEIAKLTHAVNQQTSDVTTARTTILKQFQATPHPASVKAVEEICVTCGGAHPYYQCLAADDNTLSKLRDNIQGYVAAAAVNYIEGNSVYRPLVDQSNLADPNDNLVNTMSEMFTKEHALDYSSPPLYDEYDDDLFEVEFDTEYVYDDPFYSQREKIKESKLLIDELNLPYYFLLSSEYDSFLSEDFSKVDAFPSTNNEDKVFNLGTLIQENFSKVINCVALDKKLAISHASSFIEHFDPPLYELSFLKEVPRSKTLISFSFENEEKVFKPGILTSEEVQPSLILEISHQGYKVFKVNQILKILMKIFLFSHGEDIHILDVPCLHFYPLDQLKYGGIRSS